MSRTGVQTVRREPSRRGIPNRIYRGRVIDLLRSDTRRRGIPATAVGKAVVPGFSEADRDWLGSLLAGLERDGLVDFRDGGRRIALR